MDPAFSLVSALFAALLAALLGSPHCLVMCGPLRLLSGSGRRSRFHYQAGRGLAYSILGGLAGAFGKSLPPLVLLSVLAVSTALILARVKLPKLLPHWANRALEYAANHPFLLGASSGLLPCGLLHGWIIAATATASPLHGAILLTALWAGTLPALEIAPAVAARPIRQFKAAFPRAAVVIAILIAAAPVAWRARTVFAAPANSHAHCHFTVSH